MHTDFYRMTRLHQRLNEHIRAEADRRVPDPLDLFRMRRLRQRVKNRLRGLVMTPSPA
ncbi:hypothetical protein [Sphingomonas panni]|uniref:hypothetical protein n=1 Tax=Sphingomonas panni TaxID=237612 RepID=UPI001F5B0325|nr:hypothetical protein [Sphingomonas panni]